MELTYMPDMFTMSNEYFIAGNEPTMSHSATAQLHGPTLAHEETETELQPPATKTRPRRFAPRSRNGCLTCRARKKKCDGIVPECENCIRINAECKWQKKRVIICKSSSKDHTGSSIHAQPTKSVPATGAYQHTTHKSLPRSLEHQPVSSITSSVAETAIRRQMLSYYIHTFIPRVSVLSGSSNFFTSLYVPMAFQYPGVLNAIVARAATHLSRNVDDVDQAEFLKLLVMKSQVQCHQLLRDQITGPGKEPLDHLQIIAIILLLVGLETQSGSRSTKWMQQLECARKVLAFCKKADSSWEVECIQKHFLYHDVMSIIMEDVARSRSVRQSDTTDYSTGFSRAIPSVFGGTEHGNEIIYDYDFTSSKNAFSAPAPSDDMDCLMGLSTGLFQLMREIRNLAGKGEYTVNGNDEAFLILEQELCNWKCENSSSKHFQMHLWLDFTVLAECHRLAGLILLYRRCPERTHLLPGLASKIISLVARIQIGGQAEPALTPILFLAGGELVAEHEIAQCSSRLQSIRECSKVMNIQPVEEVLRVVWKHRLSGSVVKDWLDILHEYGWTINLG